MLDRNSQFGSPCVMRQIRERIEHGGERLWRLDDFRELPFGAAAQALSRLARIGLIQRISKGVYYRPRQTTFGRSRPNPAAIRQLARRKKAVFPSGLSAANLLGFSTQTANRSELATDAGSLPRKLIGETTVVHSRRPATWATLSETDAAVLDFLRYRGKFSELPVHEMIQRLLSLLAEKDRFARLAKIAHAEPPRVRAMLGALGERLGRPEPELQTLRSSLNPLSRFHFGSLSHLPNARAWQARQEPS